jgi:hypothetical protein
MLAVTGKTSSAGFTSKASRLVGRVSDFFNQHPSVEREEFLLDAVRREIDFLERAENSPAGNTRAGRRNAGKWTTAYRPLNPEDLRTGAEVAQRVAALHYERYGLWPKIRRMFRG